MADKAIQITGDGNVVGNHNRVEVRKGGIRAEHIEAENVVDGVMAPQAALERASELVKLARAIERGGIDAGTIKAQNVVSGLYVPAAQSVAELHREVTALRQEVQAALEAGEVASDADAEDIIGALVTAEAELTKPEPSGTRIVRKLKEAAEVLTGVAEAATAVGEVGQAVIRLAPVAMMLWKLAETLF